MFVGCDYQLSCYLSFSDHKWKSHLYCTLKLLVPKWNLRFNWTQLNLCSESRPTEREGVRENGRRCWGDVPYRTVVKVLPAASISLSIPLAMLRRDNMASARHLDIANVMQKLQSESCSLFLSCLLEWPIPRAPLLLRRCAAVLCWFKSLGCMPIWKFARWDAYALTRRHKDTCTDTQWTLYACSRSTSNLMSNIITSTEHSWALGDDMYSVFLVFYTSHRLSYKLSFSIVDNLSSVSTQ